MKVVRKIVDNHSSGKPLPPKSIEQIKSDVNKNGVSELTPTGRVKKKYGPKKKPDIVTEPIPIEIPDPVLKSFLALPFRITSILSDEDAWILDKDQETNLLLGVKPAINQYVIPFIGEHFVAVLAIAAIVTISLEKGKEVKKSKIEKKLKEKEKNEPTKLAEDFKNQNSNIPGKFVE